MVWAGFSVSGTSPIVSIQGRFNSESYVDMLSKIFLPKVLLIKGGDYLFQQDSASCHVSCALRSWFKTNFVELLDWSTRNLDLNPIENLRGILAGEVYKNGKQYANKNQSTSSIKLELKNIS